MWWEVATLAMSALSAGASANSSAAASKAAAQYQAYRNSMLRISDAQNQNAITENTVAQIQQSARIAMGIQSNGMQAMGAAEVSAAAAGTTGKSVASVERNVERTTMQAEMNRRESLQDVFTSERQQREASSMAATLGQDYSYIPKASSTSTILGLGAGALKTFGGQFSDWASNLYDSGTLSNLFSSGVSNSVANSLTTSYSKVATDYTPAPTTNFWAPKECY